MTRCLLYYRPGHPKANAHGFVDARDLGDEPQELAINAPILSGRFYENTVAIDGKTDIGSRRRYRDYLKRHGYTQAGDYSPGYFKREREAQDRESRKATRETVERVWYEKYKP